MSEEIAALSKPENRRSWFALTVKPRHEKAAARNLSTKGWEEFLPLYRARRSWSDRIRVVELPLFPCYVFCRFDPADRFRVLNTPSVASIVRFNNMPAPVDDAAIDSIRTMIRSGLPVQPLAGLRGGRTVRIESGVLRGLQGTLAREKGLWRAVVNVELLHCCVAVEIDRDVLSATGIGKPAASGVSGSPVYPVSRRRAV